MNVHPRSVTASGNDDDVDVGDGADVGDEEHSEEVRLSVPATMLLPPLTCLESDRGMGSLLWILDKGLKIRLRRHNEVSSREGKLVVRI